MAGITCVKGFMWLPALDLDLATLGQTSWCVQARARVSDELCMLLTRLADVSLLVGW